MNLKLVQSTVQNRSSGARGPKTYCEIYVLLYVTSSRVNTSQRYSISIKVTWYSTWNNGNFWEKYFKQLSCNNYPYALTVTALLRAVRALLLYIAIRCNHYDMQLPAVHYCYNTPNHCKQKKANTTNTNSK